MRNSIFIAILALAGCGPSALPASAPEATETHIAVSTTAMSLTGDITITPSALTFAQGVTLFTRALEPRRPTDRIAQGGESYAEAAAGSMAESVELRRVTNQDIARDAQNRDGLCGAGVEPTYIALMRGATTLQLIVFRNDEPPGPEATQSQICATYAYAPD